MKASKDLEHLLSVFYDKYRKESVVRQCGIFPWSLTESSGIQFGDAGDALAAVNRIRERGWIKMRFARRRHRIGPGDRIQLTEEGIRHAEELLRPWYRKSLREIYVATVEGITRGITRK